MRFMLPFFLIITAIALLFGVASPALATEYFVKTDGNDTADGTNWALAFLTISNAVAQTEDDDIITVSNGTYNTDAEIYITNGITVQSVNDATNTTIKRSASGSSDPKHRIFYIDHSSAVVDGFTITNGYVSDNGGGVYLIGGTVKDCVITKCQAKDKNGSGLYIKSGGIVSNCSIIKNSGAKYGGGAYIYENGTVVDSTISGNNCTTKAGGVYLYVGGLVRNCLITGNSCYGPGGVYLNSGGTVESCAISRNNATGGGSGSPGGGVGGNGGTITNTIIYFNTARPGWGDNCGGSGITYSYVCTTPEVDGTNNITDDPLFVNATNDNYRLLPGSPCIDAGTNQAWMSTAKDLDGNDRIINGTVDIGAYEFKVGDLMCGFAADSLEGFDPHTVVYTGYVSGTNTAGLGFQWDVDNNGSIDYEGPDVSIVTNEYTSGVYAVSLTVTNAAGETNIYTRENYIFVSPATTYVDVASASPGFPYASWATAATNIQEAVDVGIDGTLVLVTDGTYEVSSQVLISDGITVRSMNGADVTLIKAIDNVRSVYLEHVDAAVDGFTLTKGSQTSGGGLFIYYRGTVRNCIIRGNKPGTAPYYEPVRMSNGGTVSNCVITGNTNAYTTGSAPGGVTVTDGSLLRNCLIADNRTDTKGPGGVYLLSGGTVESCTISGNKSTKDEATAGGGLNIYGGTVRNCIIYFNTNTVTHSTTNWYRTSGTITYSCTTPDASAHGSGNITNDPAFKNADTGDYRLQSGSPCVNVGTNQAWMTGAVDLGGYNRIVKDIVDMGAYESFVKGMIIKIH